MKRCFFVLVGVTLLASLSSAIDVAEDEVRKAPAVDFINYEGPRDASVRRGRGAGHRPLPGPRAEPGRGAGALRTQVHDHPRLRPGDARAARRGHHHPGARGAGRSHQHDPLHPRGIPRGGLSLHRCGRQAARRLRHVLQRRPPRGHPLLQRRLPARGPREPHDRERGPRPQLPRVGRRVAHPDPAHGTGRSPYPRLARHLRAHGQARDRGAAEARGPRRPRAEGHGRAQGARDGRGRKGGRGPAGRGGTSRRKRSPRSRKSSTSRRRRGEPRRRLGGQAGGGARGGSPKEVAAQEQAREQKSRPRPPAAKRRPPRRRRR